jgi:Rieske Fe-S protein
MERSRRSFLSQVAMYASLVASYGAAVVLGARYLYPRRRPLATRSIFVARLSRLVDGEAFEVADLHGVPLQVVRNGDTLRALSTVCSHLGCRVRWEGNQQRFLCPCHNAVFDKEGRVVSGPPPRPLDRYEVEIVDGSVYLKMKEPA